MVIYICVAEIPTHAQQSNSEDHETYQHEDGAVQGTILFYFVFHN